MKIKILSPACFLVFISLLGCNQKDKPTHTNVEKDSSSEDIILDKDFEEDDDLQDEFEALMVKKNFSFDCVDNCENGGVSEDNMQFKNLPFFQHEVSISSSSIFVQYRFIDDCCIVYGGDYTTSGDTLFLEHYALFPEVCDCWCEYEYAFNVPNDKGTLKKIIYLNGKEINGL